MTSSALPAPAPPLARSARKLDRSFVRGFALPLAVLAVWYVATQYKLVNTFLVAPPAKVVTSAIQQYRDGAIVAPLIASLRRAALGFSLGTSLGLVIGGLMGMSRLADRLL